MRCKDLTEILSKRLPRPTCDGLTMMPYLCHCEESAYGGRRSNLFVKKGLPRALRALAMTGEGGVIASVFILSLRAFFIPSLRGAKRRSNLLRLPRSPYGLLAVTLVVIVSEAKQSPCCDKLELKSPCFLIAGVPSAFFLPVLRYGDSRKCLTPIF